MRRQQRQKGRRPPTDAGPPRELPLPQATRTVFPSCLGECRNVGLLFDRYLRFQSNWQLGTYKEGRRDHSAKMFNIDAIVQAQERCTRDSEWRNMHQQFVARWKRSARSLGAEPFPMTPEWRLVVGLGDKGALEVGLTFHRIYGFPTIPGSALKGLARVAALWEVAEALGVVALPLHEAKERSEKKRKTPLGKLEAVLLAYDERAQDQTVRARMREEEAKALQALGEDVPGVDWKAHQRLISYFRVVFGTLYAAGQAIFLDGVPVDPPTLQADVMNVHYQDYYSEKTDSRGRPIPPADYLNPNPIPFLTVGEGSKFLFAIGWRSAKDNAAHERAIAWLRIGLSELGVGAKTAAGYGYMEVS